ncbi:MAG: hypothetical protein LBP28_09075 [Coriobacteriales bacterium]|jgi:hypothetical protein|nr:hypothetical protein [Coriobacteriales bacterium]
MADEQKEPKKDAVDKKQKEGAAYEKKSEDKTGRDWTKRKTFLKPGQV